MRSSYGPDADNDLRQGNSLDCWRAKRLLRRKGYAFEALDVTIFRHIAKAITR
jgi:hypothetical protein